LNFRFVHGLIFMSIDVVYEGKTIKIDNCILDTGSATTAVDIDLIDFNYRKPSEIKRLIGIGGGSQEVIAQSVDGIQINGKTLKNIQLEFGDLKEALGINGFIGNDVLSLFEVSISYKRQEIRLTDAIQ
jgi:hypothetical protein